MKNLVEKLYDRVWSIGDLGAVEGIVAPAYTIHRDPGDAWEGKTLDHASYCRRVLYSRAAFPDLIFRVEQLVAEGDRVAAVWSAEGSHQGDLVGLPATGKRVSFRGQTVYEIREGKIAGHWQTVDRLGFIQQFRRE